MKVISTAALICWHVYCVMAKNHSTPASPSENSPTIIHKNIIVAPSKANQIHFKSQITTTSIVVKPSSKPFESIPSKYSPVTSTFALKSTNLILPLSSIVTTSSSRRTPSSSVILLSSVTPSSKHRTVITTSTTAAPTTSTAAKTTTISPTTTRATAHPKKEKTSITSIILIVLAVIIFVVVVVDLCFLQVHRGLIYKLCYSKFCNDYEVMDEDNGL